MTSDDIGSARVSFRSLGKTYTSSAGPVTALADIDLDVPAGKILGIIGRSGAGKSSLLRMVNRLERPTSGQVLVNGQDIAQLSDADIVGLRRSVGMIFQHFNLLSSRTVSGNIALPLEVAGWKKSDICKRVDEVLHLVGLDGKQSTYPSRLSGGQKQRVGIARALVHSPATLLCDEATSALDPETTASILRLLLEINAKLNITIILITHEMSVVRSICDHVVVLDGGRIAQQGPVWQVFGNPTHEATLSLLRPEVRDIPDGLDAQLQPQPFPGCVPLVALNFDGRAGASPDLAQLTATVGAPVRVVHAAIESIQKHAVGRLVFTLDKPGDVDRLTGPYTHAEVLGYVPGNA